MSGHVPCLLHLHASAEAAPFQELGILHLPLLWAERSGMQTQDMTQILPHVTFCFSPVLA